jgi:acetolactate decarboxylase
MRTSWLSAVAIFCALLAVGAEDERPFVVEWAGEMMRVHREGDASPKVALADVARGAGRFAIGPVAGLRGEITVLDGEAFIATAMGDVEHVAYDWDYQAPFLVYGDVKAWREVSPPAHAVSITEIEEWLPNAAREHGLDPEQPFPFKIETDSSKIKYHIIANDAPGYQTVRPHSELQKRFALDGEAAVLVGVHSAKHAGIFTHHGSTTHIHVISRDKKHSGHVDAVSLGPETKYFLPAL